jgi:hypothetical protein
MDHNLYLAPLAKVRMPIEISRTNATLICTSEKTVNSGRSIFWSNLISPKSSFDNNQMKRKDNGVDRGEIQHMYR